MLANLGHSCLNVSIPDGPDNIKRPPLDYMFFCVIDLDLDNITGYWSRKIRSLHSQGGKIQSLQCALMNYHKSHQIPKLKWFLSRLAVVFAQSIEARCQVENEDVVGATRFELSTILLPTKVRLILEVLR